ncbi:allantoicase [Allonocardiopsis opalescens]|uniref:Probable allantoicase n=1 Tax=Allonocardiopsis opalescens TaxID=1144618 RepID=A0A2T0QCS2_9ACTN|nr:allantoicase [Allonocardiopsis opalescens]PRY01653.1 allantoicase [Allonocardiopsis opalescens]
MTARHHDEPAPSPLPDLAGRTLGGSVMAASDEFFAEKENLIKPEPPTHRPYTFAHRGQVYDGWETRRRRGPGPDRRPGAGDADWALVRLGVPGVLRTVVVDTAYFTGNFPPACTVQAAAADELATPEQLAAADWAEIVPRCPLTGDARHIFEVSDPHRYTHLRLLIHPDGGVARLRAHGEPVPDPRPLAGLSFDLAALENGGAVAACSDDYFGSPTNLLAPGLPRVMGEGWETRRRRDEGNDYVVVALAAAARLRLAEIDTRHFLGNAPGSAALRAARAPGAAAPPPGAWTELLPRTALLPDTRHRFRLPADAGELTHVRLDVYPDGGVARLRLLGEPTPDGRRGLALRWLNALPPGAFVRTAAAEWGLPAGEAAELAAARPFTRQPDRLPI